MSVIAYIGIVDRRGVVQARLDPEWSLSHDSAGFDGRQFDGDTESWRYLSDSQTVYWTANELPDQDSCFTVENWLDRRGHAVIEHALIEELWGYNPLTEFEDDIEAQSEREEEMELV